MCPSPKCKVQGFMTRKPWKISTPHFIFKRFSIISSNIYPGIIYGNAFKVWIFFLNGNKKALASPNESVSALQLDFHQHLQLR